MNGVKIKVVSANKEGKIELTKLELENLLNEAYRDGYCDGSKNSYTYTGSISTTPYYEYNTIGTSDATKSVTGKVATIDTADLTILASDSSNCSVTAKVEDNKYVVQ